MKTRMRPSRKCSPIRSTEMARRTSPAAYGGMPAKREFSFKNQNLRHCAGGFVNLSMQVFQKFIVVLLIMFAMTGGKAGAQSPSFPVSFNTDSLTSLRLVSTNGQGFKYNTTKNLSCFFFLSP